MKKKTLTPKQEKAAWGRFWKLLGDLGRCCHARHGKIDVKIRLSGRAPRKQQVSASPETGRG